MWRLDLVNISICNLCHKYAPQTSAWYLYQAWALHHMHILLNVYYKINLNMCHLIIWIRTLQLLRIKCITHYIQVSIHMWIFVWTLCIKVYYCVLIEYNLINDQNFTGSMREIFVAISNTYSNWVTFDIFRGFSPIRWPLWTSQNYINSFRPGDAILRHRSGSTLAQVMAFCLTAPSHYLH